MCCRLLLGHLGQVLTDFRLEICYREGLRLLQGISILLTRISQYFRRFLFTIHISGRHLIGSRKIVLRQSFFARRKKFRMFFCFGFAASAAYRALCQSCLPHSSYKTTRFCNHFVNITSSSSDPTFREKELESLKGTNCCIAILALDQEFI